MALPCVDTTAGMSWGSRKSRLPRRRGTGRNSWCVSAVSGARRGSGAGGSGGAIPLPSLGDIRSLQAKSVLEDGHRRQVKVLMTSMEATAGDPLIYSNYAVLVHFVTVLAEKEPFVAFAAVTREDGILIAHSDHSLEGSIIERFAPKKNTPAAEQDILYQGKWVSEITAPVIIGGHRSGTVLLGVNYREAYAGLHRLVIGFALAGLGVLVF